MRVSYQWPSSLHTLVIGEFIQTICLPEGLQVLKLTGGYRQFQSLPQSLVEIHQHKGSLRLPDQPCPHLKILDVNYDENYYPPSLTYIRRLICSPPLLIPPVNISELVLGFGHIDKLPPLPACLTYLSINGLVDDLGTLPENLRTLILMDGANPEAILGSLPLLEYLRCPIQCIKGVDLPKRLKILQLQVPGEAQLLQWKVGDLMISMANRAHWIFYVNL